MTQPSVMQLANTSGAVFRSKLNELISAHTTIFAGASAPTDPVANMWWQDTSVVPPLYRRRDESNTTWILLGSWDNEVYSGSCKGESGSTAKLATPRTISISGAATGSVGFDGSENVTIPLSLANSGAAAGTYGDGTHVPAITINSKGLVTGVTNTTIQFPTVVTKLNGRTGDVSLTKADVSAVWPITYGGAWSLVRSGSINDVEVVNLLSSYGQGRYWIEAVHSTSEGDKYLTFHAIALPSPSSYSPTQRTASVTDGAYDSNGGILSVSGSISIHGNYEASFYSGTIKIWKLV